MPYILRVTGLVLLGYFNCGNILSAYKRRQTSSSFQNILQIVDLHCVGHSKQTMSITKHIFDYVVYTIH